MCSTSTETSASTKAETPPFLLPPRTRNHDGEPRRVGFELEFSGPSLESVADVVARTYGGTVHEQGRLERSVRGTSLGDFRVEVDSAILKDARYLDVLWSLGVERDRSALERLMQETIEDIIEGIAAQFVPCEIVTPPIALDQIPSVELLRHKLYRREAEGTRAAILHAFGLHINAEAPSLDAGSILQHLRAFLLLYDWLREVGEVDLTRRLSPYIDDFPEVFRRRVVDPAYAPDVDRLIADYLTANPTRNRPLDLTPLLAWLRPEAVASRVVDGHLVSARPTYHYRLPNCQVDEPRWTIAGEWNRWVLVERLAAVPEAVEELGHAYLQLAPSAMNMHRRYWLDGITRWIEGVEWDRVLPSG